MNDYDEDIYVEHLFEAAIQLNDLLNVKKLKVFMHCSSGISRCPAVLIVYLCLFLRH